MYTYTGDYDDTLVVSNTSTILNSRKECRNLDELLISTADVEFTEVLGEGSYYVKSLESSQSKFYVYFLCVLYNIKIKL